MSVLCSSCPAVRVQPEVECITGGVRLGGIKKLGFSLSGAWFPDSRKRKVGTRGDGNGAWWIHPQPLSPLPTTPTPTTPLPLPLTLPLPPTPYYYP